MRLPLYLKIVCWFLLNLLVVFIFFYFLVHAQLRLGVNSLVGGVAVDRVRNLATQIAGELSSKGRDDWNAALARYEATYKVKFVLLRNDGEWLAGSRLELPDSVKEEVKPHEMPPPPPDFDQEGGPPPRPGFGNNPQGNAPSQFMVQSDNPTRYWVGVRMPVTQSNRPHPMPVILMAVSPSIDGRGLFYDFRPWFLAALGGLALSVVIWIPFVGNMTRSLTQLTRAAEQIADGKFDVVLESRRDDEIGRLVVAVRLMTERLGRFVTGQKRFLGDIAHELGSPLARMNLALGILEQRADDKMAPYVRDVQDEVQHMAGLVSELLSFTKAGLQGKAVELKGVPMREIVELALGREHRSNTEIEAAVEEDLVALAEPDLLARAIGNLIRNAIRYAGTCGPVRVTAVSDKNEVVISIEDEGPGVSAETLAHLGEPFYRPDDSRTLETGGTGLGLAIVWTCVDACRGRLILSNREPKGFSAVIRLEKAKL
jgi:two-component system sensor histidine kinase CpxA